MVVGGALDRWGWLLTAGERAVLERVRGLEGAALELYARLTMRAGAGFRLSRLPYAMDVEAAVRELDAAGLVLRQVPEAWVIGCFTVEELRDICEQHARDRGGGRRAGREELERRLKGLRWLAEPVVWVRHRGLIRRAERLFFQRGWVDRSMLLLQRTGRLAFAEYALTGGAGRFLDRRALLLDERSAAGEWAPGEARAAALAGPPEGADGQWGSGRRCWERAVEAALAEAKAGEGSAAGSAADRGLLAGLVRAGAPLLPELARAHEQAGDLEAAWALVRAGTARGADTAALSGAQRIALERIGRRLGKRLGRGLAPAPAPVITERRLQLRAGARVQGRPGWEVGGRSRAVEEAVVAWLAEAGVAAWHVEGRLWTALFALCLRDLYWLPVPGALPAPLLTGPLDLGTPAFYAARRAEVDARLAAIRAGGQGGSLAALVAGWQGELLAGLNLAGPVARVLAAAGRLPGGLVAAVLGRLAREGWGAAAGLPDLLVLSAGERLPGLLPGRLPDRAFLAEIKGPGDNLQDNQQAWLERLGAEGEPAEVWRVHG